jgi:hypothetical protein
MIEPQHPTQHDYVADICPVCGVKCPHGEMLARRDGKKRGPKPKPHSNRRKLTVYISRSLELAIRAHAPHLETSAWIREHLESMFPNHRADAERLARGETQTEDDK